MEKTSGETEWWWKVWRDKDKVHTVCQSVKKYRLLVDWIRASDPALEFKIEDRLGSLTKKIMSEIQEPENRRKT